jgi:hypothetical protein
MGGAEVYKIATESQLNRKLLGPQSRSGRGGEENNSQSLILHQYFKQNNPGNRSHWVTVII